MVRQQQIIMSQLWQLQSYGNRDPQFQYVILTSEPIEQEKVVAAWAYALRHTAKGLDLPDHHEALNLMLERHPSWKVIEGMVKSISVNLALADQDEPENA